MCNNLQSFYLEICYKHHEQSAHCFSFSSFMAVYVCCIKLHVTLGLYNSSLLILMGMSEVWPPLHPPSENSIMRHCLKFICLLLFGCLLRGDGDDQNVTGLTETVLTHMTGSCEIFYGYDQPEQAWMHLMSLCHIGCLTWTCSMNPRWCISSWPVHTHIKLTKVLHQVEENLKTENLYGQLSITESMT